MSYLDNISLEYFNYSVKYIATAVILLSTSQKHLIIFKIALKSYNFITRIVMQYNPNKQFFY